MPQSQEDFQRLYKMFEILCSMLGFGKDITESMITKYQRDYQEERGLRSIMSFLSHGGKAEHITIGEEHADMFRQRLQEKHVTYYETIITRDDNTKQRMFMYKGVSVRKGIESPTPDKLQVEQIKKMFALELSCNSKELDAHTFKSLMNGKEVGIADNLSVEQVYAFRQNVMETDIKFCVLQDKDNTYKIYANDKSKLTNVLVKMSYDLANDDTGVFKEAAMVYSLKKHDFYDKCDKEPFIICDKKNPNNFIHVNKRNYSVHSFQKEDELQADGTIKEVIRDVTKPQIFDMNKDKLFEHMKQISNPIRVSVADFSLLSNVNKQGLAFSNPDIDNVFSDFKEAHALDSLLIEKYPAKKPRYTEKNIDGYVHLPMSLVQQIKKDLPFVYTNDVDSIAFEKDNKPAVDKYLQENVFAQIKDPMTALAFSWKISGRTGNTSPQLTDNVNGEFYIINPDDNKSVTCVDPYGIHIFVEGKEAENCPSNAANYNEFLEQHINSEAIPNPVVLTLTEMQSADRNKIINERANHCYSNPAVDFMLDYEVVEKTELIENIEYINEINLSPEQEKAIKKLDKINIYSKVFDVTVFSKMQDLVVNKEVSKCAEVER